jgi:hypothetical protein
VWHRNSSNLYRWKDIRTDLSKIAPLVYRGPAAAAIRSNLLGIDAGEGHLAFHYVEGDD